MANNTQSTQVSRRFNRGDLVETWFDTGGGKMGGPQIIYGRVIAAGPRVARVRWESGLTNRIAQDSHVVESARDQAVASEAVSRADAMRA